MGVLQLGRKRANPLANEDNNYRLQASDAVDPCLDSGDQALLDTVTVSGIVVNGDTVNFPAAISVEAPADIQAAIAAILQPFENNIWVKVTYDTGTLTVQHIGESTITEVVTSGTNVTLTRSCAVADLVTAYNA
jgi:hypothetical protein